MGSLFAEQYPKVASRLLLEPGKCDDPQCVQTIYCVRFPDRTRTFEVDDEFPEITQSLLGIVYPHFVGPIPSMSIVEFQVDVDTEKLTTGLKIPKESLLYLKPVNGVPCKFRTRYDTMPWLLSVTAAQWASPDRLRASLRSTDAAYALRV